MERLKASNLSHFFHKISFFTNFLLIWDIMCNLKHQNLSTQNTFFLSFSQFFPLRPKRPRSSRFFSSIIIFDYIRLIKMTLICAWGVLREKVSEINRWKPKAVIWKTFSENRLKKSTLYISKDKERVGFVQIAKANLVYDPQNAITHRIIEYYYFF